ncbi:MAG: YIP1 family protein [Candidatus Eremiobacteraeota bacterium]|nr:YIP1 family protein [Candidatus Eremiobacteraeota bacterium]
MSVEATPAPARSGLAVLWDVIVAPSDAFAALRVRQTWVWAFIAICVLGFVGAWLQLPAGEHVARAIVTQNPTHDPKIASLTPAQREQIIGFSTMTTRIAPFLYPIGAIVAILYGALICLIANAAGKGDATFGRLFAFVANIALIRLGIGACIVGILAALRSPASFGTTRDLLLVLPSLGWLAAGNPKLAAFLYTFNPFQIWTFVLVAIGLPIVARIGRPPAFIAAAVLVLTETAFNVASAK